MRTVIMTDSCCDLKYDYVIKNNIPIISLNVIIDKNEIKDDLGQSLGYKEFYNIIRNGEMPKTSQANAFYFEEEFEKIVKEGSSVIYIAFSSALSGTYNSACIAKESVLEKYPNADITIIDSKSASRGLGLLVYYANEMLKEGKSKEEIIKWIEENKLKVNHWFTVEDLNHLARGGRLSKTASTVGTLLNIKPILHVNNDGKLVSVEKVKGRKKSISALVSKIEEMIVNPEEQIIFISHGDSLEDAEILKKKILEKIKVKDIAINCIGPAIGSHAGPGTLAVFFLGNNR